MVPSFQDVSRPALKVTSPPQASKPTVEELLAWPLDTPEPPPYYPTLPPTIKLQTIIDLMESGERIPLLVYSHNGIPPLLAHRYIILKLRPRRTLNTMLDRLRSVAHIYEWAYNQHGLNLDQLLIETDLLQKKLLDSLVDYIYDHSKARDSQVISNNLYNKHIHTAIEFLCFCLPKAYRGEDNPELNADLARKNMLYAERLKSTLLRTAQQKHIDPLSLAEEAAIRQAIGPIRRNHRYIEFPDGVFAPATALRNYLAVEIALQFGLRIGEIANLKCSSIDWEKENLLVVNSRNDPDDPRRHEPAVKTRERIMPIADQRLLRDLKFYITHQQSFGGRDLSESDYLFLNEKGDPLSIEGFNKILHKVERYAGVPNLHWHRFRHTWACKAYLILTKAEFMKMGGWSSESAAQRYAQSSIAESARQKLVEYHEALHKRPQLQEQAA